MTDYELKIPDYHNWKDLDGAGIGYLEGIADLYWRLSKRAEQNIEDFIAQGWPDVYEDALQKARVEDDDPEATPSLTLLFSCVPEEERQEMADKMIRMIASTHRGREDYALDLRGLKALELGRLHGVEEFLSYLRLSASTDRDKYVVDQMRAKWPKAAAAALAENSYSYSVEAIFLKLPLQDRRSFVDDLRHFSVEWARNAIAAAK